MKNPLKLWQKLQLPSASDQPQYAIAAIGIEIAIFTFRTVVLAHNGDSNEDSLIDNHASATAEEVSPDPEALARYVELLKNGYNPCGEILRIQETGEGAHIPELATAFGYSQRSVYRMLSRLWRKLGVTGRAEGLEQAASRGLLD